MFKKIFLFVLVVCVGATGVVYYINRPGNTEESPETRNGIEISAINLAKEYNSDEKSSDAKYLNKAIEVTGIISEIEKNQDGGSMVVLETNDPNYGIQCVLAKTKTNLAKGTTVKIKGTCSGNSITGLTLIRCEITN